MTCVCGKPAAKPGKRGPKPKWCSRDCRERVTGKTRRRPRPGRPCDWCFQPIDPLSKLGTRWCSTRCHRAAWAHMAVWEDLRSCPLRVELCAVCRVSFVRYYRRRYCCSSACSAEYEKACAAAKGARRRGAVKTGELVSLAEIAERDAGICQLCLSPVDLGLVWPDPGSPSLDHARPLANGGAHIRSNLQLTHLVCNLRKGASCG